MGRLTEALKRSGTAAAASPRVVDHRGAETIQFFDREQQATAVPWNLDTESHSEPVSTSGRATGAFAASRQLRDVRDGHRWPAHDSTEKLVVSPSITPTARERYRQLAAMLHQAQVEHGIKVVLVTSAVSGEGKTLTTANLALTLSHSYRRQVLLIDADLRHPTVHTLLGVPNTQGLREALTSEEPLPLIRISAHLSVLPGGGSDDDPMRTLASDRMRRLIKDGRARFDWVLLDTPPVAQLPDAKVLASAADVALLVTRAGRTAYHLVQAAAEAIGPERIFGVVLNGAAVSEASPSSASYYPAGRPR